MKIVDKSNSEGPFSGGVLFVCRGNAVRSQMAEGFFRAAMPDGAEAWSAGATPIGLMPQTVRVMREVGIDISEQTSKSVDAVPLDRIGTVVTLCEGLGDPCPNVPGKVRRLHWPIPDPYLAAPAGADGLDGFRAVRDEIRKLIDGLVASVGTHENKAGDGG